MSATSDVDLSVLEFRNRFLGRVCLSNLQQAIVEYECIIRKMEKISAYSFLQLQIDMNNQECTEIYQKTCEWLSEVQSNIVFFEVDLLKLNLETIKKSLKSSKYLPWIENSFRFKDHMLSLEAEEVMTMKSNTSNNSWIRLYDEILARTRFAFKGEIKTLSEIVEIANHNDDEKMREQASRVMGEGLKQNSFYYKHIYNNVILDNLINTNLRKYENPEDIRHVYNNIDKETIDCLEQSVVNEYISTSHKYYKIKAKLLGKEKINYWDRNVTVKKSKILDKKFSYEEVVKIVIDGYKEFSDEFGYLSEKIITNGWIDVMPKPGKISGAFSHHTSCDFHPYILINFFGNLRDISTLAHEIGHGIHQILSSKNGPLLAETPLTLSETASIFGESLIFENMLKNADNDLERIDMLCSKIDDTVNSVIRQIAFYEFEKEAHMERQRKELSEEDISSIWIKFQKKSLGEFVIIDEEVISCYWGYISHFFHCPFYVYSYAFGEIFVSALYDYYQNSKNKKDFVEKYTKLLSRGGIEKYDTAALKFGFDVKKMEFWSNGVNTIKKQIDDLEVMCRALSLC
jgi:oligoendopeptidase F